MLAKLSHQSAIRRLVTISYRISGIGTDRARAAQIRPWLRSTSGALMIGIHERRRDLKSDLKIRPMKIDEIGVPACDKDRSTMAVSGCVRYILAVGCGMGLKERKNNQNANGQ